MKKSLFALMASLAMVSQAADEVLNTTTFTIGSGANVDAVTCTNTSDDLQLTLTGLTSSGSNTSGTFGDNDIFYKNNDANVNSTLTPNQNVGNTGNSWTLTFTLTNSGSETAWVNSLDLTMIGINGSGAAQNGGGGVEMPEGAEWVGGTATLNKPADITLAWGEGTQTQTYNLATTTANSGVWTGAHTGTFSDLGWQIDAGESLEFTITAANKSPYNVGTFAGIKSIAVSVPEPATATLSLLALASLAARRRRK